MTMTSERLGLPLMIAGQALKEETHNEALAILDQIVCGQVASGAANSPPSPVVAGLLYPVAEGASGAFASRDGQLAAWTSAGWRFVSPFEGMTLNVEGSGLHRVFRSGAWEDGIVRASEVSIGGSKVLGSQAGPIAAPSGGTVIDAEARSCLAALLSACRAHGLIAT